jgi:hypothetical protein
LYYAKILQRVCGEPTSPIVVENKTGIDYVGINTFSFNYTPLPVALKEMWNDFNSDTK